MNAAYRSLVEGALFDLQLALMEAERQLPPALHSLLRIKKKQHALNPWDDLKWEYEVRSPHDPAVAALLVDLVQLGTAFLCLKTMVHEDPHKNVSIEQLDLRLAKTRRLQ